MCGIEQNLQGSQWEIFAFKIIEKYLSNCSANNVKLDVMNLFKPDLELTCIFMEVDEI